MLYKLSLHSLSLAHEINFAFGQHLEFNSFKASIDIFVLGWIDLLLNLAGLTKNIYRTRGHVFDKLWTNVNSIIL